jgi:hypothetical protein
MSERKPIAWVYDIECYPNLFMVDFEHAFSTRTYRFTIFQDRRTDKYNINDYDQLIDFIDKDVRMLIGYNNQHYDDLLLKHLYYSFEAMKGLTPAEICSSLKKLSDKIIYKQRNDFHGRDEYLDRLQSKGLKTSLDLLQQFNTINRVGLKQIAINLKWPKIIDLPFPPDYVVMKEDVDKIGYYNHNDTRITKVLLHKRSEQYEFRKELGASMKLDLTNMSDTGIAKTVLRRFYSEATGFKYETYKDKRSFYKVIPLRTCIGGRIFFLTPEYGRILAAVQNTTINPNVKSEVKREKQFEYIHKSKYLEHTIGLGGIHSNNPSEIIEESEDYELIDVDVSSYYPRILINEKLWPRHLDKDKGLDVYENKIVTRRLSAKEEGKKVEAESLKITANGTFGLTKSKFSWLYDPYVTTSVCIRGELFLLMLMERIEFYSDAVVVYSNTDGLTIKCPRKQRGRLISICKQWEEYTGFELEYVNFKKMIMLNVNNFLMITYDAKKPVKMKGEFLIDPPITSGYWFPVVSKALYEYFMNDTNPEYYIKGQTDVYEFMRAERTSEEKYELYFMRKDDPDNRIRLQKTNRWIVTKGHPDEGKLMKWSKKRNKDENLQKGYMVTLTNDMEEKPADILTFKIDYDFYIKQTWDTIRQIRKTKKDNHHAKYLQPKMF